MTDSSRRQRCVRVPDNVPAPYLEALRAVNGTDSHDGLDPDVPSVWKSLAQHRAFQQAQDDERDHVSFNPAVQQGTADGIGVLGQFCYYDAIVMHGNGSDSTRFGSVRAMVMDRALPPAQGGDEVTYLNAFLGARVCNRMSPR